jgi:hypothetical protein
VATLSSSKPSLDGLASNTLTPLARRQSSQLRHVHLNHEEAARLEVTRRIAEAFDLVILIRRVLDGVVHQVGQSEWPVDGG